MPPRRLRLALTSRRSCSVSLSPIVAGLATSGSRTPCAGPGGPSCRFISTSICGCGSGTRPKMKGEGFRRQPARPFAGSARGRAVDHGSRSRIFATGVKVAIVDATGKVVSTDTIYPHEPQRQWDAALAMLGKLAVQHQRRLVAIGNGTASRETDKLASGSGRSLCPT